MDSEVQREVGEKNKGEGRGERVCQTKKRTKRKRNSQLPPPNTFQHPPKHHNPHHYNTPRQDTSQDLQPIALKCLSQLLRRRHQRRVRKHEREPGHLKLQLAFSLRSQILPQRTDAHQEEPTTQAPEPDPRHVSQHAQDGNGHSALRTQKLGRKKIGGGVGELHQSRGGEGAGSDRNKNTGSLVVTR